MCYQVSIRTYIFEAYYLNYRDMSTKDIVRIKSVSQLCQLFDYEKPTPPLITVVDASKWAIREEFIGQRFTSDLYFIALKDKSCGLQYGRHHYDFDEGVLVFAAPIQTAYITNEQDRDDVNGWMVFFHPDLIRNTNLGASIDSYHFFSYDVHEALHLSEPEQKTITDCSDHIRQEISGRIDNHSHRVIVSNLELLLNYCQRFYERQFNTRTAQNKDIISVVNALLKEYYNMDQFAKAGLPSISYFADKVHLSPHYLSDLLKKETGQSAKEYINEFIVDKAKTLLLGTTASVSEIAYSLGFSYPHYFSRLFRIKTGMTPKEYREVS